MHSILVLIFLFLTTPSIAVETVLALAQGTSELVSITQFQLNLTNDSFSANIQSICEALSLDVNDNNTSKSCVNNSISNTLHNQIGLKSGPNVEVLCFPGVHDFYFASFAIIYVRLIIIFGFCLTKNFFV